jgi:hypothetical protein
MKLIEKGFLMVLFVTLGCVYAQAQEDTTYQDSARIVVPEQHDATLDYLTPPEGFEVTKKFNGYIHLSAGSAIIMTMIDNVNFIRATENIDDDYFARNQMVFIEKRDVQSDNGISGVLYKSSFVAQDVDYIRYMVFMGDLNKTLWLNITYPTQVEQLIEGEILKSIQTVNFNLDRDEE